MSIALQERKKKLGVCNGASMQAWCSLAKTVQKPSQFTPFVVVCMTACCAAREVIPGNGAMGAVSGLFQHWAIVDRGKKRMMFGVENQTAQKSDWHKSFIFQKLMKNWSYSNFIWIVWGQEKIRKNKTEGRSSFFPVGHGSTGFGSHQESEFKWMFLDQFCTLRVTAELVFFCGDAWLW